MAYNNQIPPTIFKCKDEEGREFWADKENINIPGLLYFPEFVSEDEEKEIIQMIDSKEWRGGIGRRTQHYGYTYYHTRHNILDLQPTDQPETTEDLANFQSIIDRILYLFPDDAPPTQCLVNEYTNNRGIAAHVDNPNCFGDVIIGLSLVDPVYMTFRPENDPNGEIKVFLPARSLYVLRDEIRFSWLHGITHMKRIYIPETGGCVYRKDNYRRISLTFREIKIEGTKKVEKSDPRPQEEMIPFVQQH